jgi:hypothetical protein
MAQRSPIRQINADCFWSCYRGREVGQSCAILSSVNITGTSQDSAWMDIPSVTLVRNNWTNFSVSDRAILARLAGAIGMIGGL